MVPRKHPSSSASSTAPASPAPSVHLPSVAGADTAEGMAEVRVIEVCMLVLCC